VRWLYKTGAWTRYPALPPPQKRDGLGNVWFGNASNVVIRRGNEFKRVTTLQNLLAVEQDGTIWGKETASGNLGHTHINNLKQFHAAPTGLFQTRSMVADAEQRLWVTGKATDTNCGVCYWDMQKWVNLASSYFTNKTIQSTAVDPRAGIWLVLLSDMSLGYDLVHITTNGVTKEDFQTQQPAVNYPNLAFGAGYFWLHGYAGLFQRPINRDGRWDIINNFPLTGVHQILEGKEDLLVVFNGGRGGFSGCALFHENRWQTAEGMFNRAAISPDKTTYYLPSLGRICVRQEHGTLNLENIPLPINEYATSIVPETNGSFWVSTPEGTMHYEPDVNIPNTRIRCSLPEISEGSGLPVIFEAVERFSPANPHWTFQFSWRVDGGVWSSYGLRPAGLLPLPGLSPGAHRLEVRARDASHNVDSTPEVLAFTVLPTPLQQRIWFMPVVTLIAGLLVILVWLGIARSREIAQRNVDLQNEIVTRQRFESALQKARDELEQRVKERTLELSQTNEALKLEIVERKHAEATQRKLEEQLQQAQKLKAIGTLAGGIAHDFNNILAAIIPYTQFAMTEAAEKPQVVADLQQVLAAADRAKKLVQQILTFSRQQKQQCKVITLTPIVEETLNFIRSVTPSTVVVTQNLPTSLRPVYADPTQIHQILVNLCTNAIHAMRGKKGRLEIKLDEVSVSAEQAQIIPDLKVGPYVLLSVQDNGSGMDEQIQQRIFEPLFTTKGPQEGTGLGLAVVHGIVKAHAGAITLKSTPEIGSRFEIYLPVHTGPAQLEISPVEPPAPGQGQHIMVVDDEAAIGTVINRVLVGAGYQATMHTSPAAALQEFAATPARFDLVFTDLSMPGITGLDLAAAIQTVKPNTPIILATGYGGDYAPETGGKTGIRKCLIKPLTPQAVLTAVNEVLAAKITPPTT
jgi:signal transduction histidine kinase/ActR/RegA family two-component response regulator